MADLAAFRRLRTPFTSSARRVSPARLRAPRARGEACSVQGLGSADATALQSCVDAAALDNAGMASMYALVAAAQEWLSEKVRPSPLVHFRIPRRIVDMSYGRPSTLDRSYGRPFDPRHVVWQAVTQDRSYARSYIVGCQWPATIGNARGDGRIHWQRATCNASCRLPVPPGPLRDVLISALKKNQILALATAVHDDISRRIRCTMMRIQRLRFPSPVHQCPVSSSRG